MLVERECIVKKQPEKTAQTKQSLIDAYWQLAKQYGIKGVTVNAVALTAGLNRATFYAYFVDINELLCQAEEQILDVLQTNMQTALSNGLQVDFNEAIENVLRTLAKYDEKLFLLLGKNGDPNFVSSLRQRASVLFNLVFKNEKDSVYKDYVIAYATSALVGLLTYWHESGRKIGIDKVADICRNMTIGGLIKLKQTLINDIV
ncbi:MAG: TetR/AcrR family transcriptional regulator [Clostridia bacterium]|nr:TetR/AcrR family transcriptional regulator [Clostridia bacterium]